MRPPERARYVIAVIAACSVHLFTATGALFGLLAMRAIVLDDYPFVFLWMGLALVVDSVDGTLARAARVKEVFPNFDGALMDNIIDYLNYVIVPAFLLLEGDLVAGAGVAAGHSVWGYNLLAAALIALSSLYQFCRLDAKTRDNYFTGFPSYWNLAVFYLYYLNAAPLVNFALLAVLAGLVFVPVRYIYPSRTAPFFALTLGLTILWFGALAAIVCLHPAPPRWLVLGSLAYVAYYFGLSGYLTVRRRRGPVQAG